MKRVLFISSTGGHLTELLQLEPLFQHYEASLVTEKTKSNASLKQKYGKRMHYLAYGTKQHLLPYLFIFAWNIIKSFALFVRIRPDVVITTGTHKMCIRDRPQILPTFKTAPVSYAGEETGA